MSGHSRKRLILRDGSRVSVVGGGPAGAFFAFLLLRKAKEMHRNIAVTIIDAKGTAAPNHSEKMISEKLIKGCNYCAGVVSPGLHDLLRQNDLEIPPELICENFTHLWIHGLWKNFPFRIPTGRKMYSVFRGNLPPGRPESAGGFDNYLLQQAVKEGAALIAGEALKISCSSDKKPLLTIKKSSGGMHTIKSDFVAIATGVTPLPFSECVNKTGEFFKSYRRINPQYIPPKRRSGLILELKPGRAYLKKYMNKELYLIESGSKRLNLEHAALIPKGDFLTIALIGEGLEAAYDRGETRQVIETFLSLPHVRTILPGITLQNTKIVCLCSPYMAVKPAQNPFSNRTALVGDALGAKLYKDGLYSAFISARALAETVLHKGLDKNSLFEGYGRTVKWLQKDNRSGRLVFGIIRIAFRFPILSRIFYQTFATEMKFRETDRWPFGSLLWKIGSGSADYRDILRESLKAPVIRSVMIGAFKTARNILTEFFFGIKWEALGRYPTVILKEKRDYFKKSIASHPAVSLDDSPEMERMYAIKIRASSEKIYKELGRFGEAESKFLKLRFLDVKRVSGSANQVGAVVQYRLKNSPLCMNLRLTHAVPGKTLLYEPSELFATRGKLLFDITPAADGNNRLVVYTAFDFKKGKRALGNTFWKIFKKIFPEYAHDVVWNHAVCRIKGEAEKE